MCTNYTPGSRDRLLAARLVLDHLPPQDWRPEIYPGYEAPIIIGGGAHGTPAQCLLARFGLIPRWSKDAVHAKAIARGTYNARSETASVKPSFRAPWRERRFALAPMDNFFEPCWETGRAVRWRIARADAYSFAAAALWERWVAPESGEIFTSFSLLTTNADGHDVMGRMHRPGDEKRMPVIIAPEQYQAWLHASAQEAQAFMRALPAGELHAEPAATAKPVAQSTDPTTAQTVSHDSENH